MADTFHSSGVKEIPLFQIDDTVLGEGRYAQVKKAKHKKTGKMFAVKIIDKDKCNTSDQAFFRREIAIMHKVDHPNCIKCHEMFEGTSKLYFIMELVTGGELFDRIVSKTYYSEKEAASCTDQILNGINYLHGIGIVHRDMKPENVLYESPSEDSRVKIADFGLGRILDLDRMQASPMKTLCGTPVYIAPEVLLGQGYGQECDVWSVGNILYVMLCGRTAFDDQNIAILLENVKRGNYSFPKQHWAQVSEEAQDLVKGMMHKDPKQRLTASQCLEHKWLKSFRAGTISVIQLRSAQDQLKVYVGAHSL